MALKIFRWTVTFNTLCCWWLVSRMDSIDIHLYHSPDVTWKQSGGPVLSILKANWKSRQTPWQLVENSVILCRRLLLQIKRHRWANALKIAIHDDHARAVQVGRAILRLRNSSLILTSCIQVPRVQKMQYWSSCRTLYNRALQVDHFMLFNYYQRG